MRNPGGDTGDQKSNAATKEPKYPVNKIGKSLTRIYAHTKYVTRG